MPDLVTHAAIAYLFRVGTGRRHVPAFVAGSYAPDLLCRVPALFFTMVNARVAPMPDVLIYGWEPLHTPIGMLLSSFLLSRLFVPTQRNAVFGNLFGGMLLHLALDVLQEHWGVGHLLLFPVTSWSYELAWVGSEDSVFAAPVLGLAALLTFLVRRRRASSRA